MNGILSKIAEHKVVPVIKLDDPNHALPLSEALIEGGLPVAEITFRTNAAEESIKRISKKFPSIILGAGTVVNVDQVQRAVDAGAKYIVTPGFSHKVVEYCVNNNIAITPGACTPTEVQYLLEYDLEVAKFFPAEQYGGLATIKALAAPFTNMKFMPTGGIGIHNIMEYLAFNKVIACGGSWMVKGELIANGKFNEIKGLVEQVVNKIKGSEK